MQYFIPFALIGAVVALGIFAFIKWLQRRGLKATWYEWLIGGIGLVLLLTAVQHFFGARSELFPYAAWLGFLIIGLPALILLAVAWQLITRRQKASS
ncbi:dehalogenase [Dehalogenimonas etheniformans]|uniref:Dehalogenase n=1 Tax=Dehalogenimonas etheniformans TaxID=1536648 RepID=A0A2P5PA34_9CHLR|nr:dehalogenase [Dehalogenimonas etheniformans]PPD59169.1 dehalogenase [Dehalogenimonas etheniformans]QNT75788.1 dehalogenase [Dehalogenimonas etheniformans]